MKYIASKCVLNKEWKTEGCELDKCEHVYKHEYCGEDCDGEDIDEKCKCISYFEHCMKVEIEKERKRNERRKKIRS